MNTFTAIIRIIVVILAAIILVPYAFIADTITGGRDYTFSSMFVDLMVILRDIWTTRYSI